MAPREEKWVVVTESFSVEGDDGVPITLNAGVIRNADDPVAQKYKQFFKPMTSRPVEQATAAPGEKRA